MLTQAIKSAILQHAAEDYPRESCGVIVDDAYVPCRNIHAQPNDYFEIDSLEFLQCQKLGKVKAIVHSHPDGTTTPSATDRAVMAGYDIPWVITDGTNIDIYDTDFYIPMLGREYIHGLQDCYTIVKDYYERELGIKLGDYERKDRWWEDKNADSLYLDNFEREGFYQVDDLKQNDVILCRVGRTEHINHAVIYLGDGQITSEITPPTIGSSLILHHPYGRPSVREVYGEIWHNRTQVVIRHRDLL